MSPWGAPTSSSLSPAADDSQYTKAGAKVGAYPYSVLDSSQDAECDNLSYGVAVLWIKEGYKGRIVAIEQPSAGACVYGGGV